MPDPTSAFASNSRRLVWATLLVAASLAFTLGFACAVPFAAFGAVSAMTLPRRDALLLIVAVWLVNQIAGFAFLHYPWDAMTLAWSPIFGAVALASTVAAQAVVQRGGMVRAALAGFAAAFVVYEGSLSIVSATVMGGTEIYMPAIIGRILAINAAGFVALLGASLLIATAGAHVRMSGRLARS